MPERGSLVFECGPWEVDTGRRELRARGAPVPLGGRAFEIMEALIRSGGELVTKDELMGRVWPGAIVEENTLQVHISAVRKALGSDRGMLKTSSRRGYRLLGTWTAREVSATAERAAADAARTPEQSFANNLPAASSELIGRDAAVQELRDLLSAYRLVSLVGPGGIGKTALMLDVARRLLATFPGDACLVEFASLVAPGLVPSAVASALGLKVIGDEFSPESVARAIGSRKLLLVIDNCEHVIDAAAGLAETVLRRCPGTTVVATSREVLRVDGEYVYRVPALNVPPEQRIEPGDVLAHTAVQLFIARARALGGSFAANEENLGAIAAICRRLDGIPLAIEFAAARAATLGPPQVAALLDDRFEFLAGGRRTALPRHQTLRATLDWSYDLLPEIEAATLRRIALFAGDFSLDAAAAVAGDLDRASIARHIADLVAKSLVVADLRGQVAVYRLLDTTRLHAVEKLDSRGEYHDAARRHAEYYRDLFARAQSESEARPQVEWVAIYGRHIANVRAALDWAFSPDGVPQIGVALTVAAVPLWVQLSLLAECRERVERALARLDGDAPSTARSRMQLTAALGWSLMYGVGRVREAGPAWATTLALAESLDDGEYRRRALWGLCIDQFNNGEFRTALDFARRFAGAAEASADAVDGMMADRILATALHYLGDQRNARHHIERVVARLGAMAHHPQLVRYGADQRVSAHYFQARILWLQGLPDQALRIVERNIEEGRAGGNALTLCSVLGQAACPLAFLAGDLDAAERHGAALLDHTERHPVRLWHLWARCFKGMVMVKRGEIDAGLAVLRGELERAGEARFLPRFLLPVGELAACLGAAGEAAQGLAITEDTLARCRARDEAWYVAELLRIKGELHLQDSGGGSIAAAEECFGEALELAARQGALFWELRSALSLAGLRVREDRQESALDALAPVYRKFTEGFDIAELRQARALLETLPQPPQQ